MHSYPPHLDQIPPYNPKPFYTSKVFWVNIVSLLLVVLAELAREQYGLSASWLGLVALLTPVLNVVLRFVTTQPVALSRGSNGQGPR